MGEVIQPGDAYDAGLLNDYGGGNVDWWQDYIRAELGRAHDFYGAEIARLNEALDMVAAEREAWKLRAQGVEAAIYRVYGYSRSDGNRTFDDCIRDLGWIDDICRSNLFSPQPPLTREGSK